MTAHTGMASHNLEEEEATHFIPPRLRSGRIYFSFAAIGAVVQSKPTHDNEALKPHRQTIDTPLPPYFIPSRRVASVQN